MLHNAIFTLSLPFVWPVYGMCTPGTIQPDLPSIGKLANLSFIGDVDGLPSIEDLAELPFLGNLAELSFTRELAEQPSIGELDYPSSEI